MDVIENLKEIFNLILLLNYSCPPQKMLKCTAVKKKKIEEDYYNAVPTVQEISMSRFIQ